MSIYSYHAKTIHGEDKSLRDFEGKVLLIVNTASECGFTPQFQGLQKLYDEVGNDNFEILGFPCNQFGGQDPGSDGEIAAFCSANYGVSFPMFSKVEVKGDNAHPLFKYLTSEQKGILTEDIKWNFTKFLVDKNGDVVDRFAPQKEPAKLKKEIENLIGA
ncbi:glutathione peroxidase [Oceanobacillus alkalisoli]|uniref:glutathione peroxidase n=1 Tax=Oceanobacillus alkalisoli TaxID=2925113 RepID=UPI001EF01F8E|nr:glutathione peroxidase [Oceanobacillus alkalisoli]MCF3944613.1 glutathione peroxidase [Oceanobacillus alkalisoli]MCG5104799.1 glutathione peroxidase [Oceanobacillus alkalisoli]